LVAALNSLRTHDVDAVLTSDGRRAARISLTGGNPQFKVSCIFLAIKMLKLFQSAVFEFAGVFVQKIHGHLQRAAIRINFFNTPLEIKNGTLLI